MGLKLGTPLTISYQSLYEEPIFVLCCRCDRKLDLMQLYQHHKLLIVQQEGHVVNNHKLWINPSGLFLQNHPYLVLPAMLAIA